MKLEALLFCLSICNLIATFPTKDREQTKPRLKPSPRANAITPPPPAPSKNRQLMKDIGIATFGAAAGGLIATGAAAGIAKLMSHPPPAPMPDTAPSPTAVPTPASVDPTTQGKSFQDGLNNIYDNYDAVPSPWIQTPYGIGANPALGYMGVQYGPQYPPPNYGAPLGSDVVTGVHKNPIAAVAENGPALETPSLQPPEEAAPQTKPALNAQQEPVITAGVEDTRSLHATEEVPVEDETYSQDEAPSNADEASTMESFEPNQDSME